MNRTMEKIQGDTPTIRHLVDINDAAVLNQLIDDANKAPGYYSKALVVIRFGSKTLSLNLSKDGSFGTYISSDPEVTKIHRETTICYTELYSLLQRIAKTLNREITYYAVTEDEKMEKWIRNRGNDIFSWSEIQDFNNKAIIAKAEIAPQA